MIPITQTKVVVRNSKDEVIVNGNCYAAVIASILEVPITEVPNVEVLFKLGGWYWQDVMLAFLKHHGWELFTDSRFQCFHDESMLRQRLSEDEIASLKVELKDQYYFVSGRSPRGVSHITIWQNGLMVHDPHPSRDGIQTLDDFQALTKTDTETIKIENNGK